MLSWIAVVLFQKQTAILTHQFQTDVSLSSFMEESYLTYLETHSMTRPSHEIIIDYNHILPISQAVTLEEGSYYGKEDMLIVTSESSRLEWSFSVPEAGYYHLELTYFPIEGKSSRIERKIIINGSVPYQAAERVSFERVWIDQTTPFLKDVNGNDIIPRQIEAPRWIVQTIDDAEGLIQDPLLFYFEEGLNQLTLESLKEPMVIDQLRIFQKDDIISYEEYQQKYSSHINQVDQSEIVLIQGQNMKEKSSPTLYPVADRTSPISTPQDPYKLLVNTGGGYNWRIVGDWISYQFEINQPGFYQISMRAKQSYIRGAYVSRQFRIDGEVPFEEASSIPFVYSGNFDLYRFGEDDGFQFYFEEGIHELSFEVVLGDFNSAIHEVADIINTLNKAYRDIIMITTTQPDIYRDYQLTTRLPDLLDTFLATQERLERISAEFYEMTQESSQHTVILDKVALQ